MKAWEVGRKACKEALVVWEVWEAWVQWLQEWLAWLGRFSKTLEFGTAAFPGSAAWHEWLHGSALRELA